jgi:hypothetical protein
MQVVSIEIYHARLLQIDEAQRPFRNSFCAVTFRQARQLKGAVTP